MNFFNYEDNPTPEEIVSYIEQQFTCSASDSITFSFINISNPQLGWFLHEVDQVLGEFEPAYGCTIRRGKEPEPVMIQDEIHVARTVQVTLKLELLSNNK